MNKQDSSLVSALCARILALLALTIRYAASLCSGIKNARSGVENRQVLIGIPQWSSFIGAAFSFTLNIFAQLPFQSVCCPEAKASQQCCLRCCQEKRINAWNVRYKSDLLVKCVFIYLHIKEKSASLLRPRVKCSRMQSNSEKAASSSGGGRF